MFVANFKTTMRVTLLTSSASLAAAYWAPAGFGVELGGLAHMAVAYGAAALAFLAFPTCRRSDLSLWAVVGLCAVEVVGEILGRPVHISDLAADCLGVAAVMTPSWIEGLRRLSRGGDWTLVGQRRRRGDHPKSAPSIAAGLSPRI